MDLGFMLGFFEFFIILAFGLGWAVLELYTSRLDKRKREREEAAARTAQRVAHDAPENSHSQ